MKRYILSSFSMALFLMLFVVGCQKVNEPTPQTQIAKTPQGNKNGSNSLQQRCLNNQHLRNTLITIVNIAVTSNQLTSGFTESQKQETISVINSCLMNDSIPNNPLGFIGYVNSLYQQQQSYLLQEYDLFLQQVPDFTQATLQKKKSVLMKVISDILIENPNEPIYIIMGYYECVADAVQEFTDSMVKCRSNAACQALATGRLAFRTYLCTLLN